MKAGLEAGVVLPRLVPGGAFFGAVLGATILSAAIGTTLIHREPKRAIAPAVAFVLTAALAWLVLPDAPT